MPNRCTKFLIVPTSKALFAGLEKLFRPAVIEVLHDPFTPAQFGDAVLAA